MPFRLRYTLLLAGTISLPAFAQHPFRHHMEAIESRFATTHPVVSYTLTVDAADLSGFAVEVRLRNVPDTFRVAMAAHPEYDDRYWRYVENLRIEPSGASIALVDSSMWRVRTSGGNAVIRYRIKLPAAEGPPRAAWRPFLARTGGLVGGPHAFMYVVGAELAPAHVQMAIPAGWEVATGLTPTLDPRSWFAASVGVLMDSPIFAGRFAERRYAVDGVPHRVVYWGEGTASFDTTAFVSGIERMTRQATALFGRAPYRDYTFVFQDASYGGLEHINSVTLGAPSDQLAANPNSIMPETAHEFVHTWNLMRLRPVERTGVTYRTAPPTRGLWWSEGLTLFYADLLLRRGGVPVPHSTRAAHLEQGISSYLANPGYTRISPERASEVAYNAGPGSACPPAIPGGGCDYSTSVHIHGELLGAVLDLIVRDATNGRRSMDHVMRLMAERYSGERGFTGADIERTVADVCGCAMRAFFDAHVRAAQPLDFDRYLRLIGLRTEVEWSAALDREGRPVTDRNIVGYTARGDSTLRLMLTNPHSTWGRAGLHTGDRLVAFNGAPIRTWPEMRAAISRLRIGDSLRVDVMRRTGPFSTTVPIVGFDRPVVRIVPVANPTAKQRALREQWERGAP